jgi:predicted nucleic acid-binding protein
MAMPVVVLDACVLFQGKLTNLLLNLAEAKAFEPIWSEDIHTEWMGNLAANMAIPGNRIAYRRAEMEKAFPVANVPATLMVISAVQAKCKTAAQRKDAHVVATALKAHAGLIVTHNIKDFAPQVLGHYGLSKIRPDPFCVDLLANRQSQVIAGVRVHRSSLKKTPMSPEQYLDYLTDEKLGMPKFAKALFPYANLI